MFQNLQLVKVAFCTSKDYYVFKIVALAYTLFLLVLLFIFAFLTLRSTISAFHREGVLSYLATTIALLPLPLFNIILTIAIADDVFDERTKHIIFARVTFALSVLLPLLIISVLFIPNVSKIIP